MASPQQSAVSPENANGENDGTKPRRKEKRPEIVRYIPKGRLSAADDGRIDDSKIGVVRDTQPARDAPKGMARKVVENGEHISSNRVSKTLTAPRDDRRPPAPRPRPETDVNRRPDSVVYSARVVRSRTNSITSIASEASERSGSSRSHRNGRRKNRPRRRGDDASFDRSLVKSAESCRVSARSPVIEKLRTPPPPPPAPLPQRSEERRISVEKVTKPKIPSLLDTDFRPPCVVASPVVKKPAEERKPAEEKKPDSVETITVPKEEKPVPKEEKPVPKEEKPVPKEEKPVPKEEKPVPKEEQPVTKGEKPVAKEEKPFTKEERPFTKEERTVPKEEKPETKEEEPEMEEGSTYSEPIVSITDGFTPQIIDWSNEVEEYERKHPGAFTEPPPFDFGERMPHHASQEYRDNEENRRGARKNKDRRKKGGGKKLRQRNENSESDGPTKRQGGLIHVPSSVVKDAVPAPNVARTKEKSLNRAEKQREGTATRRLFDPRNPDKPLLVHIPNDRAREVSDSELVRRVTIDEGRSQRATATPPPLNRQAHAHSEPPNSMPPTSEVAPPGFQSLLSGRIDPSVMPALIQCSSQLDTLLQSNNLARDWARISDLRTHLFGLYKMVLLGDLKFFEANNLEQMLWKSVFYAVIERLRRACSHDAPEMVAVKYRELLVELINQGKAYFTMLLESLESAYRSNLDDYVDGDDGCEGNWARPRPGIIGLALISAQKLCLYMGDLARYKELYCEAAPPVPTPDSPALRTARRHYARALELNPKNGHCYNQMAYISLYNGRKLDAVYFYCRSLMTVNVFQSAKESLLSIFEDTKRKWDEKKRKEEADTLARRRSAAAEGGSRRWKRTGREVWIHPDTGVQDERWGSEAGDGGPVSPVISYDSVPRSQLIKDFTTAFLVIHGMLFTKVNFETFEEAAVEAMQLFKACVKLEPFPFTMQRLEQYLIMNMFAVEMNSPKGHSDVDARRAVIGEHAVMLMLEMMSVLLEQACRNLLDALCHGRLSVSGAADLAAVAPGSVLKPQDLVTSGVSSVFLPMAKIWCDWLICYDDVWFPAPPLPPYHVTSKDVWQNWADFLTLLQHYSGPLPALVEGTEGSSPPSGHRSIWLPEDKMLTGFYPLTATHDPVDPVYCEFGIPKETAEMALRMSKLKTCCEFMCGLDPPFIKYSSTANAFVSVVPVKRIGGGEERASMSASTRSSPELYSDEDEEGEEDEKSALEAKATSRRATGGMNKQMRSLLREHDERNRDGEKRSNMRAIFKTVKSGESERRADLLQVLPKYLVPDTNCLIEDLDGLRQFISVSSSRNSGGDLFSVVVPLLVMGELQYIGSSSSPASAAATAAFEFLRSGPRGVHFCTSRGSLLKRYSAMDEAKDSDGAGAGGAAVIRDPSADRLNDEVILTCCRNLAAKNPCPRAQAAAAAAAASAGRSGSPSLSSSSSSGPGVLTRHVVLLTDDRNLRVRGRSQDDDPVPAISLPEFLRWAGVAK